MKVLMPYVISACLALEAWTLKAVVDLKVQVAELSARVTAASANTKYVIK